MKFYRYFVVLVILFTGVSGKFQNKDDSRLMEDFARNAGGEMPDFGKGYGWLKNEKKLTDIGFYCLAFRDIEISYWTVMDIGWFADIGSFYQSTS